MSVQPALPSPETVERQFRLLALILLQIALGLILKALTKVVTDGEILTYLNYAKNGAAVFLLGSLLVFAFWKIQLLRRVPKNMRGYLQEPEGFACEVWKRAVVFSWGATIMFLYLMATLKEKFGGDIEFYSHLAIAVMLGVFSLSFFYLYRTDDTEDSFEGSHE